jgi:hypothetical protein
VSESQRPNVIKQQFPRVNQSTVEVERQKSLILFFYHWKTDWNIESTRFTYSRMNGEITDILKSL